jgi:hypothetical protein
VSCTRRAPPICSLEPPEQPGHARTRAAGCPPCPPPRAPLSARPPSCAWPARPAASTCLQAHDTHIHTYVRGSLEGCQEPSSLWKVKVYSIKPPHSQAGQSESRHATTQMYQRTTAAAAHDGTHLARVHAAAHPPEDTLALADEGSGRVAELLHDEAALNNSIDGAMILSGRIPD